MIIIAILLTILSIYLIYKANWIIKDTILVGSIFLSGVAVYILLGLLSTPIETAKNNSFLGAEISLFPLTLIPGFIVWGLLSIIKIIIDKIRRQ